MNEEIKKELGLDESKPIPPDYPVPFYVHEHDFNKMDMNHKKIEKWLFILCFALLAALLGTNGAWLYRESQYEDVVTETYSAETDGGGTAIVNGDGSVTINGESDLHKNN